MKKYFLILLILPFILLESCKNDFDINAPHKDIYVLNCILRNDDSTQYAVVSKNLYTGNGTYPTSSFFDQSVKGASIKIYYNNSVFVMRDTTVLVDGTQVNCYYVRNLKILPGYAASIEAVVPDGQILKSTIQVPNINFNFFETFPPINEKGGYLDEPYYLWNWISKDPNRKKLLGFPQFTIYYKKYEGGKYIIKKAPIPIGFYPYVDDKDVLLPINMDFTFNTYCMTTQGTIYKTMDDISGDDPNKDNYIITYVIFDVTGLDYNLSKYYSTNRINLQSFTIKLKPADYSNIEGGKGIFGALYKFSYPMTIDSAYVAHFHYKLEIH